MRDLIESWKGEAVVTRYDRESGTWFLIALHSSTLGMPVGGCRMRTYQSPEEGLLDAMRLAEGMTYKWASNDVPFGGGKSVLAVDRPLNGAVREEVLRRFGRLLHSLSGAYATGVDLADFDGDLDVNITDFNFLAGNYALGGYAARAVAEPSAIGLLVAKLMVDSMKSDCAPTRLRQVNSMSRSGFCHSPTWNWLRTLSV